MNSHIVKWNTGRLISKQLDNLKFFNNYKGIHLDLYELYIEIKTYANDGYYDINNNSRYFGYNQETTEEWIAYLDKVLDFQRVVEEFKDTDQGIIAKKAIEVFDNKDVGQAYVADLQILKKLDLLLEYSESVRHLFNFILPLYDESKQVSPELEQEILEVLENKGLGGFEIPADLLVVNENATLS